MEKNDAARLERNRYMREYRAKNKEKVKAINKKYWEKRAARNAAEKKADCAEETE